MVNFIHPFHYHSHVNSHRVEVHLASTKKSTFVKKTLLFRNDPARNDCVFHAIASFDARLVNIEACQVNFQEDILQATVKDVVIVSVLKASKRVPKRVLCIGINTATKRPFY